MPTLVSQRFFGDIPAVRTAVKSDFVSVEDYLAAEEASEIRHEYSAPEITLFRRSSDWKAEKVSGAKATALLRLLKFSLPLSAVYEGV